MLARLEATLPRASGWRYEPKFDGFRGLLWRNSGGKVQLLSRNLKDLTLAFPELVRAGEVLPPETLLDGEIVIADATGAADFGALQSRLGAGSRGAQTAATGNPAVLLAFDLRRHAGTNLIDMPLHTRRAQLVALLEPGFHACSRSSRRQLLMRPRTGSRWCQVLKAWWPSATTAAICPASVAG